MNEPESALATLDQHPVKPETRPGADLSAPQRALAEAIVTTGKPVSKLAPRFGINERSVYYWLEGRYVPGFKRYLDYLTDAVLAESRRKVRATAARYGPDVIDRLGKLATGKAKPRHPYEVNAGETVLAYTVGKPAQSQELGIKVPTEHGDVIIVWRSGHDPSVGGTLPDSAR